MDESTIVRQIAGMDNIARPPLRQFSRSAPMLKVQGLAVGALEDVSFELHAGEILGIAGLAGSGRSSLLRCLSGLRNRRTGSILLNDQPLPARMKAHDAIRRGIAYIPEERMLDAAFADKSVRENFTMPRVRHFWKHGRVSLRAEQASARAAIDRYKIVTASTETTFASLSGGNQQKVILARWLELEPQLLLLDEPSQGVDVGARNLLHALIRGAADRGVAVIVASSDSHELADLSDRVIGLSEGHVRGEASGDLLDPQTCIELAYGTSMRRSNSNSKPTPDTE
jgi:ribose transport system ATP-binding protein